MRLVLCDDQRILIESLAIALQARGYEVLAAVTTPEECMKAVAEKRPDVCLLDLYLPGREDGLQTAQAIRTHHPDTQVLILSGVADPLVLSKAIDLDVAGIVRKDQTVDKIAAALQQVAAEERVFHTELIEVLRRIAAGESTKQMARSMQIAASTVRTYAQNVLTKLGAHSRLEASAIAVRARLVDEIPQQTCSPP